MMKKVLRPFSFCPFYDICGDCWRHAVRMILELYRKDGEDDDEW